MRGLGSAGLRVALACGVLASAVSAADQSGLEIATDRGARRLAFEWPALHIGTAEYPAGPTGVTVFYFPQRALGVVDVRGGGPGTVNTDYLRLGYEVPELDAVVFSGGSWYGLESTTAIATALTDAGIRNGSWDYLSLSVGAIIYDLGDRRLIEIYPDMRLAPARSRSARRAPDVSHARAACSAAMRTRARAAHSARSVTSSSQPSRSSTRSVSSRDATAALPRATRAPTGPRSSLRRS
jgi:hypothetical protein